MADRYADAVYRLEEAVDRAAAEAEEDMTSAEIASELRRIANDLEDG